MEATRWLRRGIPLLLLAVPLALAACGGAAAGKEGGGAGKTTRAVSGNEFAFRPAELRVKANQEYTVQFTNTGQLLHDFVTRDQSRDGKVEAEPGRRASGTFKAAAQPGRYEFYCVQPGHEQAGMKGVLIVE